MVTKFKDTVVSTSHLTGRPSTHFEAELCHLFVKLFLTDEAPQQFWVCHDIYVDRFFLPCSLQTVDLHFG